VQFGLPISEYQGIRLGLAAQHAQFFTGTGSSAQLIDWVEKNGDPYRARVDTTYYEGTRYEVVELSTAWSFDSRNRSLFATEGTNGIVNLTATIPDGSVGYWTAQGEFRRYFKIPGLSRFPLSVHLRGDYAQAYAGTTAIPPTRNYLVGGPDTVRGFRESGLGPRDSRGNAYGGDAALTGQLELAFPTPAKFQSNVRVLAFVDLGEAAYLGNVKFYDREGFRIQYPFRWNQIKASTGIAVEWLAPLGLFRFSFAQPLRYQSATDRYYGDDIERFQFTSGQAF
jgi:outer membrane protein insertion porin family